MNLEDRHIHLFNDDAINCYSQWETPMAIISDGPFGIKGYKGDLSSTEGLAEWYEPHIKAWSLFSKPYTTLWFWNTEQGWASVHNTIIQNGWDFKSCCIWNKGMSHVAGNTNIKTLSHLPIVTEVCVQYVRRPFFIVNGKSLSMKEWLRYEWGRTGLPFSKTNEACGVVDAATRKYFTKCDLWYMPPASAFQKIVDYANNFGNPNGKPYFSVDGKEPLTAREWELYRAKFDCPFGQTNVWDVPQLRNGERLKNGNKALHMNQKPLSIIRQLLEMSTAEESTVWDPFGGLFTTAIASLQLNRHCFSSEINTEVFELAFSRVENEHLKKCSQLSF